MINIPIHAGCFAIGTPQFKDPIVSQAAIGKNIEAGWRQAFRKFGTKAPEMVTGDFAVGLRDDDGRVFLAVDRFAIRTLCYRQIGDELHFAERADQLADSTTEIDLQAVFDYFYFHIIPSPRTIFKNVFRVPPAHCVLFEKGQLTVTPYWTAKFDERCPSDFNSLRNDFRNLLKKSVADQLDGGKPGCFLSGGTDSSTVAGMVEQACGQRASTYSIGFEAEGYDEMAFARIAARHFGTDHHEYYVTPDDIVRSIPLVAQYYDQPFGNSSALPAYYCARMAKDDGVTRILAGDGGDELFGGNARYAKQRVFGFYDHVPAPLRSGFLEPLLLGTPLGRLPLARKGASYIRQAKVPLPERGQTYNLLYRLGVEQVFNPEFLSQIDQTSPDIQQRTVWQEAIAESQTNRELAFDWRYTLAECDLPKVVGTTQLAGLAVGFPMLDQRLVDFSRKLPPSYKLKGLKLRWFFKEALRGFLPDEILVKKKQGFGLPFGVWTAKHPALKSLAENSVRGLVDRRILQSRFVDALFKDYLYEHPGYYGEMIWISTMLEQWLQRCNP